MNRPTVNSARRPRLLCMVQLPPPVHGVTVMNDCVVNGRRIAARFTLDVIPLRFAESVGDIGRFSSRKVARACWAAARLLRRLLDRPDAVYFSLAPTGYAFYRDCVYIGIVKVFGVPRIFHMHGTGVAEQLDTPWRRALYTWAFRDARLIHLSRSSVADTQDLVSKERVCFVPNGLPDRGSGCPPRAGDNVPRVLFLSNLIEEKGPLVLLDALATVRARGIGFTATFAGAPGHCLGAFNAAVSRHELHDCVTYVGPVYGAAKDALFRAHDVFVLPSFREAFGLVLIEAMQHYLPVIASSSGAIPEIVDDGETGFLVPARDVDALADRLATILADRQLRIRMGERGRSRYEERYTLEHFEQNLVEALQQLVPGCSAVEAVPLIGA